MIVHRFLAWVKTAPAAARATATDALARAYLQSTFDPADRANAEAALTLMLDDPEPRVRATLAEALASAPEAPRAIIVALASDTPDVAAIVLSRSPLLGEGDLVHHAAMGGPAVQSAIARRFALEGPVCAALAEIGEPEALLELARNHTAEIPDFAIARMVERHGGDAALRQSMLQRPDLSLAARQALLAEVTRRMDDRTGPAPLGKGETATGEAGERATLALLAGDPSAEDLAVLIAHLRRSGQLNARLVLRALILGYQDFVAAVLADLAGMAPDRVAGLLASSRGAGFAAVYRKAKLPAGLQPVFVEVLEASREFAKREPAWSGARLAKEVAGRILDRCAVVSQPGYEAIAVMLRHIEAEAALEDARQKEKELLMDDWSRDLVRNALAHETPAAIAAPAPKGDPYEVQVEIRQAETAVA
jgi:uncharacterized protein (DUF2336 family)